MDIKLMWEIYAANHSLGFISLAEAFKGGVLAAQENVELAATDNQQLKREIRALLKQYTPLTYTGTPEFIDKLRELSRD